MNICVYGAASSELDPRYLEAAEQLGFLMAKRGHSLVFGGGKSGMMGAAARGVTRGGGTLIGVAPEFFRPDGVLYENCTQMLFTATMRERKQKMEDAADAFIMTPGGVGTLEEFFEILTLRQLGRHDKPIAVLNTRGYYDPMERMLETAVEEGFLRRESRSLYHLFCDEEKLLDYLEEAVQ